MMILAIGIKHALDVPVQRLHDADPADSLMRWMADDEGGGVITLRRNN